MGYRYLGRLCLTDLTGESHTRWPSILARRRDTVSVQKGSCMKPYRSTRDHVGAVHQKGASGHRHLGILNCLRHVPKKAMNGMQLLLEIKALESRTRHAPRCCMHMAQESHSEHMGLFIRRNPSTWSISVCVYVAANVGI